MRLLAEYRENHVMSLHGITFFSAQIVNESLRQGGVAA